MSVQVSAAACMHGGASDAYRCRCMHSVTMYMQGAWMHGGQLRGFQCESTPCFPVQQATPAEPRSCLCKLSLEASTCYTCGSSGSTPHAPFTLSCSPSRTGRSAPTRVAPRSTTSTRSRRHRGTCSKMWVLGCDDGSATCLNSRFLRIREQRHRGAGSPGSYPGGWL